MIPILEEPAIRRQVRPISVETYHLLGETGLVDARVELLRGVIVNKMSKSPLHSSVCQVLLEAFRSHCREGLLVRQEQPLTFADSEPGPDIAIVEGTVSDYYRAHPATALLVVEVAISTEETDTAKADIYAEAGVAEYWLVLPLGRKVKVFREPTPAGYALTALMTAGEQLSSSALPGFSIDVAAWLTPSNPS